MHRPSIALALVLASACEHAVQQKYLVQSGDTDALRAAQHLQIAIDGGTPDHFGIGWLPGGGRQLDVWRIDGGFTVTGITRESPLFSDDALGPLPRVLAAGTLAETGVQKGELMGPRSLAFAVGLSVLLPWAADFYAQFANPYAGKPQSLWLDTLEHLCFDALGATLVGVAFAPPPPGTLGAASLQKAVLATTGLVLLVLNRAVAVAENYVFVRALNALSDAAYPVTDPLPAPVSTEPVVAERFVADAGAPVERMESGGTLTR